MILDCNWHVVSDAAMRKKIKGKNVCIFGASKLNNSIYEAVGDIKINFVLDNDESKWGDTVNGVQIVQPQFLEDTIILSAVADCKPLAPQLRSLGYREWYFFISEPVYEQRYRKDVEFIESADSDFVWSHSDYKYIHIIPDQKFIYPVVTILERSFDIREHAFLIYGFNESNPLDIYHMWGLYRRLSHEYGNIALVGSLYHYDKDIKERLQRIENNLPNCDKIFFHGEWLNDWVFDFFIDKIPFIHEKGVLLIWSGNFGSDWQNEKYIHELLRFCHWIYAPYSPDRIKYVCSKIRFPSDTVIVQSGVDYSIPLKQPEKKKNDVPRILISHSCFPYNRVMEGLDLLKKFKDLIDIFCLASYGDPAYIEAVRTSGHAIYGDRFHCIETYMHYPEYVSFINSMDIAVFAMDLPGGFTTLSLLAYTGAKLFLRKDGDVGTHYTHWGFGFSNVNNIPSLTFEKFLFNKYRKKNYEAMRMRFDVEANAQRWREVFVRE